MTPIPDDDQPQRVPPEGKRGGAWVAIGAEAYRIPALGLLQVQDLEADLESLRSLEQGTGRVPTQAQMKCVAKIVHAAMSRNYPNLKQTEVEGMLDLGNFWDILMACLVTAGFKRAEGLQPGEAGKASTGASSTPP